MGRGYFWYPTVTASAWLEVGDTLKSLVNVDYHQRKIEVIILTDHQICSILCVNIEFQC